MQLSPFWRRLLAPLVYLAALALLFEQWLWEAGARVLQRLAAFWPLRALERAV
ncbi:MAG: hypothetical protein H7Z39_09795, partial [Burkholderiaceae bacterium]|nr:hypothetical protein [Burkholderiaceae bacterium]